MHVVDPAVSFTNGCASYHRHLEQITNRLRSTVGLDQPVRERLFGRQEELLVVVVVVIVAAAVVYLWLHHTKCGSVLLANPIVV